MDWISKTWLETCILPMTGWHYCIEFYANSSCHHYLFFLCRDMHKIFHCHTPHHYWQQQQRQQWLLIPSLYKYLSRMLLVALSSPPSMPTSCWTQILRLTWCSRGLIILLIMPTTASFDRLWMSWWGKGGNRERNVGRKKEKDVSFGRKKGGNEERKEKRA